MGTVLPEEFWRLPEKWFELVESVEALKEHRFASLSLESSLAELSVLAEDTKRYLDLVCTCAMHLMPERWSFYEGAMQKIGSALEKFSQAIEDDVGKLHLYLELAKEIRLKERKLGIQRGHRQELEQQVQRACAKAEKLRDAYEKKVAEIRAQTDERLAEIRDSFLVEARLLLRGCRVYSDTGEEVPLEVLFEHLIREPNYHERIRITGLVLKKDPLRQAIKELADEGARKIPPLLEEERRKLAKLEEGKRKVERASSTCEGLREELKEAVERERELEKRLEVLRKRAIELEERFNSYGRILSLRENYLSILNSATGARKRLFLALEEDFRDYIPEESDAEKRELREELRKRTAELEQAERRLKEAEQKIKSTDKLEKENSILKSEIENLKTESKKLHEKLEKIEKEKSAIVEELHRLRIEIKREKDLRKAVEIEKNKIERVLKEEESEKANLKKTIVAINAKLKEKDVEIKELKNQVEKLLKENERLKKELNDKKEAIDFLKARIEAILAEKFLKRRSQAKPMKPGSDEAYVGEKIDALRRRR